MPLLYPAWDSDRIINLLLAKGRQVNAWGEKVTHWLADAGAVPAGKKFLVPS